MNQQKKQLIIVGLLGVVLAIVLVYQLTKSAKPPEGAGPKAQAKAAQQQPQAGAKAASAKKTASARPTAGAKPGAAKETEEAGTTRIREINIDIDQLMFGIKEVSFDYEAERMPRDPMKTLLGRVALAVRDLEATGQGDFQDPTLLDIMKKVVSGIVWDANFPLAVVDNEVVYPGYEYDNHVVVESIEPERVVFKYNDTPIPVELKAKEL